MDAEFFHKCWIGKVISFTDPPSSWRLTEKLSDKNNQITAYWMEYFPDAINGAYATFKCQNVDCETEFAFIRITMQVPFGPPGPCLASQASDRLPPKGQQMLEIYDRFQETQCISATPLLNKKIEQQDANGMLSGGSILYLLIEKVPGRQLNSALFWGLGPRERASISRCFRVAWEECVAKGYKPFGKVSRLFWHSHSDKMVFFPCTIDCKADNLSTFYNFVTASPAQPHKEWSHIQWIAWDLAKAPAGYQWWMETQKEPDMRTWTL